MRLTAPAKRALGSGLVLGLIAISLAFADSTRRGLVIGVALLISVGLVVAFFQYAGHRADRT